MIKSAGDQFDSYSFMGHLFFFSVWILLILFGIYWDYDVRIHVFHFWKILSHFLSSLTITSPQFSYLKSVNSTPFHPILYIFQLSPVVFLVSVLHTGMFL